VSKQRYLILSARFLADRYHGCVDNGERAEWPPSPWRLFQALIAGNARGVDLPEQLRAGLRWLEALAPPVIVAPSARAGQPILTYVPNNTGDKYWPPVKAPKALRPTLLNGDRLVEFVWSFDDSPGTMALANIIAEAAGHLQCLGWGVDMAIGRGEVVDSWSPPPPGPRVAYRPVDGGEMINGTILRTPCDRSLKTLETSYREFLARYEDPKVTRFESPAIFGRKRYAAGDSGRPWAAFRLRRTDEYNRPFSAPLHWIPALVGMIRHACAEACGGGSAPGVAADILGHREAGGGDSRVSIMVLPTTRDGPTDGRIRRIAIAEPPGNPGRWVETLRRRLDGQALRSNEREDRFPPLLLERIRSQDKVLSRYVGTSATWVSVTPILLPGFDDPGKNHSRSMPVFNGSCSNRQVVRLSRAEGLVQKCLDHAGISACMHELVLSKVPFVTGARYVRYYTCHRKLKHYPRYFAKIIFSNPLSGPLSLGAGRHAGFGAMVAADNK
jgi:CRISPR-associated protein Csb2